MEKEMFKEFEKYIKRKYPLTRVHPKSLMRVENTLTIRTLLEAMEWFEREGYLTQRQNNKQ